MADIVVKLSAFHMSPKNCFMSCFNYDCIWIQKGRNSNFQMQETTKYKRILMRTWSIMVDSREDHNAKVRNSWTKSSTKVYNTKEQTKNGKSCAFLSVDLKMINSTLHYWSIPCSNNNINKIATNTKISWMNFFSHIDPEITIIPFHSNKAPVFRNKSTKWCFFPNWFRPRIKLGIFTTHTDKSISYHSLWVIYPKNEWKGNNSTIL